MKKNSKLREILVLTVIALPLLFTSFWLVKDEGVFSDEGHHFGLIEELARCRSLKDLRKANFERSAPFPGYHVFVSAVLRSLGKVDMPTARLVTTGISFLSVLVFYLVAKKIDPRGAFSKTLQYIFFPLLFVFFSLVYTDVLSLLLVILSLYFLLTQQYKTSALAGLASTTVRQNNVIWVAFLCLLVFYKKYHFKFTKKALLGLMRGLWPFIPALMLVPAVVFWQGALTIGDAAQHPLSLHSGNLFFILFEFFYLFLPLNTANFPKILKAIKKRPYLPLVIIPVFLLYILTFKANHFYNSEAFDFFPRNKILVLASKNNLFKLSLFLPISYSLFSLWVTKLQKRCFYLLYPFTVIFLSLSWLIETRYHLIPFVLFLLFRKRRSALVEYLTIFLYVILTGWIFWGTLEGKFFL